MASTTFCDWCGEIIEVAETNQPLYICAKGDGGNGRDFMSLPLPFNFHAGGSTYDEIDPGSCIGQLETLLAERASWAHDPEQEGQEWRLVPREGSQPILSRSQRRRAARVERSAEQRERDERWRRWEEMKPEKRRGLIRGQLEHAPLTAREIAETLECECPEMKVIPERIRPIVAKMVETGELERKPERYRKGDSIRYRYSLKKAGDSPELLTMAALPVAG